MGAEILPSLQKHLRSAESISWGLKVLTEVASPDEAWPILTDLCERNDNSYTRDPSKKVQLLHHLGEGDDPRGLQGAVALPDRHGRGRPLHRRRTALLRHKDVESAGEPLLQLLTNDKEESRRIKKRIIDGFADLGWDVKGFSGTVEKMLPDMLPGARLDNHGKIKRKQV